MTLAERSLARAPLHVEPCASFCKGSKKRAGFAKRRGAGRGNPRLVNRELNKFMFGPIIVFAVAVALVATYILIVNRLLCSDEHWNENSQALAPVSRARAAVVTTQTRSPALLTPNHA
jgi:hypothetical protein